MRPAWCPRLLSGPPSTVEATPLTPVLLIRSLVSAHRSPSFPRRALPQLTRGHLTRRDRSFLTPGPRGPFSALPLLPLEHPCSVGAPYPLVLLARSVIILTRSRGYARPSPEFRLNLAAPMLLARLLPWTAQLLLPSPARHTRTLTLSAVYLPNLRVRYLPTLVSPTTTPVQRSPTRSRPVTLAAPFLLLRPPVSAIATPLTLVPLTRPATRVPITRSPRARTRTRTRIRARTLTLSRLNLPKFGRADSAREPNT